MLVTKWWIFIPWVYEFVVNRMIIGCNEYRIIFYKLNWNFDAHQVKKTSIDFRKKESKKLRSRIKTYIFVMSVCVECPHTCRHIIASKQMHTFTFLQHKYTHLTFTHTHQTHIHRYKKANEKKTQENHKKNKKKKCNRANVNISTTVYGTHRRKR